jgi:hypothetical protein
MESPRTVNKRKYTSEEYSDEEKEKEKSKQIKVDFLNGDPEEDNKTVEAANTEASSANKPTTAASNGSDEASRFPEERETQGVEEPRGELQHQNDEDKVVRQRQTIHRQVGKVKFTTMKTASHHGTDVQKQLARDINQANHVSDDSDSEDEGWEQQVRRKKRRVSRPPPEVAEFPVILEDVGKEGEPRYQHYGQFTGKLYQQAGIAPIRRQRRLASGKWLIHCQTLIAQQALAKKTNLGGVQVKCYIPTNKTVGVVRPVPQSVPMAAIKEDNSKLILSAERLNKRDGQPSNSIKIVFDTKVLPDVIRLGNELMTVTPFTEIVLRCTRCQRLGHKKAKCPAKLAVCARCGKQAHHEDPQINQEMCPVSAECRYCINCKSVGHSAAWKGCPRYKLHKLANSESSRLGIPPGIAMHKLSQVCLEQLPDVSERDHSYYHSSPKQPPCALSTSFPPLPERTVTSLKPFSSVLRGPPPPSIHKGQSQSRLTVGQAAAVKEPAAHPDGAACVVADQSQPTAELAVAMEVTSEPQATQAAPSLPADSAPRPSGALGPQTADTAPSLMHEMQRMMSSLVESIETRVQVAIGQIRNEMNEKLKGLERDEDLANSVMDKINEQRKQQFIVLKKRTQDMKSDHPVAKLLGNCLVGLVSAVEANQPEALLLTLTNMYNAGHAPVTAPEWTQELNEITQLALGYSVK